MVAVLLLGSAPSLAAPPEAALSATFGPSGNAPLLVYFEGTGSTDPDTNKPTHHLTHCFDAGDGNTDAYTLAGHKAVPKANWCGGPQFAYVYETPGSYTATLTVYDQEGNSDTASVAIQVEAIAASKTVCIADDSGGSFNGCPSGAARKTEADAGYEDFDNAVRSGCSQFDQVLFQRGATFAIDDTAKISCSAVGTYGSGSRTQLSGSGMSPVFDVDGNDRRVWGFAFRGNGTETVLDADKGNKDSHFVLYRDLAISNMKRTLALTASGQGFENEFTLPDVIGLFELEISEDVGSSNTFFIGARRFAFVGSTITNSPGNSRFRLQHVGEDANGPGGAFIVANKLSDGDDNSSTYSIRAAPNGTQSWGGDFWNENIVTADNWFEVSTPTPVNFQTNKNSDAGTIKRRNHIYERNYLTVKPPGGVVLAHAWRDEGTTIDMTFRNNIVDLRGANSGARAFGEMGDGGWEVYNNAALGEESQIFWKDASGPQCVFRNNVFWSISGSAQFFSGAACANHSHNWDNDGSDSGIDSGINTLTDCPFRTCEPRRGAPRDFQLASDILADAGTAVPARTDFAGQGRPHLSGWDVGPWEKGGVSLLGENGLAAPFLR